MDKVVNIATYRGKKRIEDDQTDLEKMRAELDDIHENMEVLREFFGISDDYEGDDE